MILEIDATFENGLLNPDRALPLREGERVKLSVRRQGGRARASYGLLAWNGGASVLNELLGPDNLPGAEIE